MKINSIFQSINGEVNAFHQGSLCTFIRFQGCPLSCRYCDTKYAQDPKGGKDMTSEEVIEEVGRLGNHNITITGGEPLYQEQALKNVTAGLEDKGYAISVETNGALYLPPNINVSWVADWKGPSSGMRFQMELDNFLHISEKDFVKFVIEDEEDFSDALEVVRALSHRGCKFAFSPSFESLGPVDLVSWMQQEKQLKDLGAILSWQIHKLINVQ
ncbi:MAG: radical SAM protein [Candidatus Paceibacterota bacterium]